jgi:DNA-binding response OmpR family regulator
MNASPDCPSEHGPEQDVVLIVDDVPENLALLSDALDAAGYMVLVALDGMSALERIKLMRPDVILLDAMMPGLNGFETCRRIKAQADSADIPVLFMTALTESEHVVEGFAAGGNDYVTKPIKTDEVLARVAAHLRTARSLQSARKIGNATPQQTLNQENTQEALAARYQLTGREVEVLSWVACGKTNRDIGDILGLSPRTVNKHLEHVYVKLGVETRTAAAAVAMSVTSRGAVAS